MLEIGKIQIRIKNLLELLYGLDMVHFSKIFFSKNSKNLCHFSKNSKKFRKNFSSQINELSVDVSVSNGVLILKKGCLYIK
jgi:hypothetical protein